MPTYEYICEICQTHFEKQLHFTDDINHVTCPQGHQQTKRIFAKPTILFKGSGFYVTDREKSYPAQRYSTGQGLHKKDNLHDKPETISSLQLIYRPADLIL